MKCDEILGDRIITNSVLSTPPRWSFTPLPFSPHFRLHPHGSVSAYTPNICHFATGNYIQNVTSRRSMTVKIYIKIVFRPRLCSEPCRGELKMLPRNLIGWGDGVPMPCAVHLVLNIFDFFASRCDRCFQLSSSQVISCI